MIERSLDRLQQTTIVLARTANTVARSQQILTSAWNRIYEADAHMAAQAGRYVLAYFAGPAWRPADPPNAVSPDPEIDAEQLAS